MCTVTYLPLGGENFCLTSNRDETPSRQPLDIFLDEKANLLYPKEPRHGGTWIAVSGNNRLVCLLNGAFEKHKHEPPYRKSRGHVVLDFFGYIDVNDFVENYNFDGIEPFTMVIFENGLLFEYRWDGIIKHLKAMDSKKPHIWSSSTLYNADIKKMRESWFSDWQHNSDSTPENILKFHQQAGSDDAENGLIMSRHNNMVCTVSITQAVKNAESFAMKYIDRINQQMVEQTIQLEKR